MAKKLKNKKELFGRMVDSLQFFLNPEIIESEDNKRRISAHLANGDLVVLRKALQEPVAEKMFACLDQASNWKVYEDYSDHFHYHHHNLYEDAEYPEDLQWCRGIFQSDETKSLMGDLSQRDCSGPAVFSASWYLPGDHSLPHNDVFDAPGSARQVAYVWHLTKDWQPNWGGDLFWCRRNRYVAPSFNTLILFNVGPDSYHHVTTVSPYATSKRLAISGWWTSTQPSQALPDEEEPCLGQDELIQLV